MKLSQLAAKPQLIKVVIDNETLVKDFSEDGTPIEFWTWDRQPLDVFMKLANTTQENASQIIDIVRTLILTDDGKQIISEGNMLPTQLLMEAIAKIVDLLGK